MSSTQRMARGNLEAARIAEKLRDVRDANQLRYAQLTANAASSMAAPTPKPAPRAALGSVPK